MGFTNKSNFLNQTESNFLKEQLMDKLGARMDGFFLFFLIRLKSSANTNVWLTSEHSQAMLHFHCFLVFIWSHLLQFCQNANVSWSQNVQHLNTKMFLSYWLCLFHKVKQLNEHPLSVAIPYFSCISLVLSIARNRMEPANTYEWQVICIPIRVSSIWLICHKGPYDGGYLWAGFPVSAEDSWSPFRVTASSCSPPETKHTLHSHLSWSEVCFV